MKNVAEKGKTNVEDIELLDAFLKVAPYLNQLVHEDITVGIYDTEKLIVNYPAKTFSLHVQPGDPLQEGDIITNAIRQNKLLSAIVPKELFGVDLIAKAMPIHDHNGRIVGGIGIGVNMEKAMQLSEISSNLSAVVEEVTATIQSMADSITELSNEITTVSEKAKEVAENVSKIEGISNLVKEIADRSNLLGLNAAIEAARAGEHGRGFSIVADEVRKMANTSKQHVAEINEKTNQMKNLIKQLNDFIQSVNEESSAQSAAIEELSATMQEINTNIQMLAEIARQNIEIEK
ncbi:chemotaxis protein [Parageobacillus sp. VR-IP]|uniref:methyl-accepting chemotaxis protein n=1 Tax=Parageobacillus sp. VR-IP TaxID=2742205 RepID=UPI00158413A4|nr:methyl-accepting chemotaxis protein [Parageobacillus sp. VR-IP]NUK31058.1 chemotaxis protein [Parageobacillus sp. VR-IP]